MLLAACSFLYIAIERRYAFIYRREYESMKATLAKRIILASVSSKRLQAEILANRRSFLDNIFFFGFDGQSCRLHFRLYVAVD